MTTRRNFLGSLLLLASPRTSPNQRVRVRRERGEEGHLWLPVGSETVRWSAPYLKPSGHPFAVIRSVRRGSRYVDTPWLLWGHVDGRLGIIEPALRGRKIRHGDYALTANDTGWDWSVAV
jgi:hypothetical protein